MPATLEVNVRKEGQVGILETDGYINDTDRVAQAGHTLIDEGLKRLVINMGKSRIISSIGVSVLAGLIGRLREMDGKVAFCCATPTIGKTFRIMGLLKVADLYDTEEEAVRRLGEMA